MDIKPEEFILTPETPPPLETGWSPPSPAAKNPFGRLGWGFIILLLSSLVLPGVILAVVILADPAAAQNGTLSIVVTYASLYLVGFPLMLLSLRGVPDTTPTREARPLGLGSVLALYPVCFAVVQIIAVLVALLEAVMGRSGTVNTADLLGVSPWALFATGVVVAPVMEELIFRRLIYKKTAGYGPGLYIGWSALVFGLFHVNLGQSLYAGVLGAVLAFVMLRAGRVWPGILLHVLINLTGGVGIGGLILRSGSETANMVYSIYIWALTGLGVVLGIILWRRGFFRLGPPLREALPLPRRRAFLNTGTLVYTALCLAMIVAMFFVG